MNILFERSFAKDLKAITDATTRSAIQATIQDIKDKATPSELTNCKKLHGYSTLYRLRIGDYRLGMEFREDDNTMIIVRCLHRKEIYRYFP
jgi:mRNA interferase RelE/StbE